MTAGAAVFAVSCSETDSGARTLQSEQQLERFLAEVERRALRIAEIAVRDRDEAMDLVQDAMIRLVRRYARRSSDEWPPLFYRILHSVSDDNMVEDGGDFRLVDRSVIERLRSDGRWRDRHDGAADPEAAADDGFARTSGADIDLERAIAKLPARARMVFVLHDVEGHKHREIVVQVNI